MEHHANLQRIWDLASERDIAQASASFEKYQKITGAIAEKYGFTPRVGAGVFAALSPNSAYWGNLRDTDTLLRAAHAHKGLNDFNVSTYGPNKAKAWRIAHGEDPGALIVAMKTRSFFHNIVDPSDPAWVTIDGHMHNIFHGVRRPIQSHNNKGRVVKVSKKDYFIIADAVKVFAQEKGLIPCQMQSCLWITWRRIHRILTPAQQELWDRDYHVAGLGFVCS